MLMGHFGRPESLNLNKKLDSLDFENSYNNNNYYKEVHSQFQAQIDKNPKGKQVKGIPNPRYKKKRNFSKFERKESSKSTRQRHNLRSSQYKRRYAKSFRGYPWQNPRRAYWKGHMNDCKRRYI